MQAAQRESQIDPGRPRTQVKVEERGVQRTGLRDLERLAREVGRDHDVDPLRPEGLGEGYSRERVVLDDEDADGHAVSIADRQLPCAGAVPQDPIWHREGGAAPLRGLGRTWAKGG